MKKQIIAAVATLSLIIAVTITSFAALTKPFSANIPFDFMVNGKQLPAGNYIITEGTAKGAILIRNWQKRAAAISLVTNGIEKEEVMPRLVFHRYGNQIFLAQVYDGTRGQDLPRSKAEREAARAGKDHLAMNNAEPEVITVIAQVGQ